MTTTPTLMDEWNTLPWKKIELSVFKLQQRIYRASERGDHPVLPPLFVPENG
jgi:RNA-directed DNA polymerase